MDIKRILVNVIAVILFVSGVWAMGSGSVGQEGLLMLIFGLMLIVWANRDGVHGFGSSKYSTETKGDFKYSVLRIVRSELPGRFVLESDWTVIPDRRSSGKLEISVYVPSLQLGFDVNSEREDDHNAYWEDLRNGTAFSEQRYKELWCENNGIKLVQLWDSDPEYIVRDIVKNTIKETRGV